ncbi:hypothetical protein C2S52_015115 [Perilla frutescens var. hirtella]|nr:hypothetical protein C2S52_015115 [Perilla frutescens var. hirtella]
MDEAIVGGIVGAIVGPIVQGVVKKLVSVSAENIKFIRDFKKDLENLKISFDMIQQVLYDAEMRHITDRAVKRWLDNLEDVAFQTDHVLDIFIYVHLRRSSAKNNLRFRTSPSNYFSRLRLGRKIRDIKNKLELINKEAQSYGLQTRFAGANADPNASATAGLETDSFANDQLFLGRDEDVAGIAEILTTSTRTEQVFSVVAIVGMGGSGKTTLARRVYHDEMIRAHFGARIWVHVSQNFDPISVFKKFLMTVTSQTVGAESREIVLKKLQETLRDKTYLLVLDDVWDRGSRKWEDLTKSLSGVTSTTGNAIIVTTRNTEVASVVKPLHNHRLHGLSEEDCWLIIKEKTFGDEFVPFEFEAIGRKIARRCRGLPLAANVVGGVLRGKSKEKWLRIERERLSFVEGDDNYIKKILRLSFDDLDLPFLKKCFTYCSVFPKGEEIEREELIELWMAEGFLQSDQTNEMEIVGSNFLDLLLQSSLLQVVERDNYGNVTRCGMHDLVHDLAFSLLTSPVNDHDSEATCRVRYLGLESSLNLKKAKHLRTWFYRDGDISDKLLNFKCLHALTLTGDRVIELPGSVGKLIHLRYLNISRTRIPYLPNSIYELCFLQTFRANKGKLTKLPSTFSYLISLRHLHIDGGVVLPPEIGRITSLQTLPHFTVSNEQGCRIGELGSLQNLKGKLRIYNLEEVRDEEEAKEANLRSKPNLYKLRFAWDKLIESEANAKNVFEGLQPHQNLKSLSIHGFKGTSFPLWTLKMAVRCEPQGKWRGLNCLMKIKLSNCNCEEIPKMGHLPHLKSLYLKGLPNVRSIDSSFYGTDEKETVFVVFPSLERLTLTDMPNLTVWAGLESPSAVETRLWVFPRLEYLRIYQCRKLKSAPTHFPCLKELDICKMDSGLPLSNICGMRLKSLTELSIERIDELECLPDWLLHNNQTLSTLSIRQCSNLRELPDGLDNLSSLKSFSLVRLSSLMNLPRIIDSLQNSPRLTQLTIALVPNFVATSLIEVGSFRYLQQLEMDVSLERRDSSVSVKDTVDGILQACSSHSLWKLNLTGMEMWDSLPEPLQHLTTLSYLLLENLGIQVLPEWFGNLSSLQILHLRHCKNLRRLTSVRAMQRTRLEKANIYILDCPELSNVTAEQLQL